MKEEMSNRLTLIEADAFCTDARCLPLPVNYCVRCCSQHSLTLTVFAIFTTQFSNLTKNISISKHHQLAPLVDDDSTP